MLFSHVIALFIGYVLDLIFGDPYRMPHIVRGIGRVIGFLDPRLRRICSKSAPCERCGGIVLVLVVVGLFTGLGVCLLWICGQINAWLACAVESVMCYQLLAVKSLKEESMKVYAALVAQALPKARTALSYIVGRDTNELNEEEVAKAAVETIAENTADGVVAPLLCMAFFGAPGALFLKSVNTLDSMVGYRNETYRYFGTAAARLDDVVNFIPARIGGILMCLAAPLVHLDGTKAWRIFKRDRKNHSSPNSAHTEAACAGALGIQVGGAHYYFGKQVKKPFIGDATRHCQPEDIVKANRLLYATSVLCLAVSVALGVLVACVSGGIV